MRISKALNDFAEKAKARDTFWVETAKLNFAVALEKQRRTAGLTYAELAEKVGTSAPYISKVFRGDANLTIESMVKLSRAAGAQLDIKVSAADRQDAKSWAWAGQITAGGPANQSTWRTPGGVTPSNASVQAQEAMYG